MFKKLTDSYIEQKTEVAADKAEEVIKKKTKSFIDDNSEIIGAGIAIAIVILLRQAPIVSINIVHHH